MTKELAVCKGRKVSVDPPDRPELLDKWARLVHLVYLDSWVNPVPRVLLVLPVLLAIRFPLLWASATVVASLAPPVQWECPDRRVCLVREELMENVGLKEALDRRACLDHPVPRANKVPSVLVVLEDCPVLPDHRARLIQKESFVRFAHLSYGINWAN